MLGIKQIPPPTHFHAVRRLLSRPENLPLSQAALQKGEVQMKRQYVVQWCTKHRTAPRMRYVGRGKWNYPLYQCARCGAQRLVHPNFTLAQPQEKQKGIIEKLFDSIFGS